MKFEDLSDELFNDRIEIDQMSKVRGGDTISFLGKTSYVYQNYDEWAQEDHDDGSTGDVIVIPSKPA